ncbi:hypothetical protein RCL_jg17444.t1 [Rhizophagus clarus]|uniref:Uncharacterized protein n=1 Tax=Rhizophagus clarus TaxID=94130 RepID=A0A8H3KYP1_9GLOM|nr:hypothetical protein RCL_jg17444.t1 [Rhizophagus clarus]
MLNQKITNTKYIKSIPFSAFIFTNSEYSTNRSKAQNPKYLDLKFYKYRASVKYIYIINFLMTSELELFRQKFRA